MTKTKTIIIQTLIWIFSGVALQAQTDLPETLNWANNQANFVDSALHNSILVHDPIDLMLKITECYIRFEAVSMAGLYCQEARVSAEKGKNLCDVINFRLDKDVNSIVLRATEARLQAENLRRATLHCLEQAQKNAEQQSFRPVEIIQKDLEIAILDLSDGNASEDMHILTQKIGHAIRILHEVEHLTITLNNCQTVFRKSGEAIQACEAVLSAHDWKEVNTAVQSAIKIIKAMQSEVCF